jgi:hypothetical protein
VPIAFVGLALTLRTPLGHKRLWRQALTQLVKLRRQGHLGIVSSRANPPDFG